MQISSIKTKKVSAHDDLYQILDESISNLQENSVVVVTSKIVALCEGRVADPEQIDRDELVSTEADYYLPREHNKYGFCLSIKDNTLIASAGIDKSNADGQFVLWPIDSQKSANSVREYLKNKFNLKNIGVIITDSHVLPLRWGTHGTALAHSGFLALNDYIGKPDIYGEPLKVSRANVAEGLASAAVVVMGEGSEQTPLALITDVDFVQFQDRDPNQEELDFLKISIEDDIYAPLLTAVKWKKRS